MAVAAVIVLIIADDYDLVSQSVRDRSAVADDALPSDVISEIQLANVLTNERNRQPETIPVMQPPNSERAMTTDDGLSSYCSDAAEELEELREDAANEIPEQYAMLFDHAQLTGSEKQELTSFLVELHVAGTSSSCKRSMHIEPQDRADAIESIIGPTKLDRFLTLEKQMYEYGEVSFVDCVLNNNGSSLTGAQRDRLFEIIVDIAAREEKLPGSGAERESIEYLEYHLSELNERTRLFLERVASELTTEQFGHLFNEYQRISYSQAESLERQKMARLDPNQQPLPWHYPARSCVPRR